MTTKAHNEEVERLKFQGFETHGFKKSIIRTIKEKSGGTLADVREEVSEWLNVIPDGYKWVKRDVDGESLWQWTLVVAEVENLSLIRKTRLDQWCMVWFYLDCECIDMQFKVITVGREPQMIDMEEYYFEHVGRIGREALDA